MGNYLLPEESEFIHELLSIFGLEGRKITKFVLKAEVGSAVTLTVEEYIEEPEQKVGIRHFALKFEEVDGIDNLQS